MKSYQRGGHSAQKSFIFLALGFIVLISFGTIGCASTPAVEDTPSAVATMPVEPEPQAAPEPEPEPVFRTVYLMSEERSYVGDGRLDSYRRLIYDPAGIGLHEDTRYTADGRVVQVRRYELEDGRPVEERVFDEENRLRSVRRYGYDVQGNMVSDEQLDAAEEYQTRSTYGYDAEGRRTSWQVFSSFAGLMGSTAYTYEGDRLVRVESFGPGSTLEESFAFEFDTAGRSVKRTQYDLRDRRMGEVLYEYEGEHLVRETVRRAGGAVQRSVSYEYDNAGNVVGETHHDASGNVRERIEREFITREIQE